MDGNLERLEGMYTAIPRKLSIFLLVAFVQVKESAPITAAIKTLSDSDELETVLPLV